jgi:hypothetical protein
MTESVDQPGEATSGYGHPPQHTRFRKGVSGNPKGRPRGTRRQLPHDAVLGQMVTIREAGRERRVTAAEAFLLHLTQKGLAGDSAAARASLEAIEIARAKAGPADELTVIILSFIGMAIEMILEPLGIAKKKYPYDKDRVRWQLEPWIVQAALARLDRQLTPAEQGEVWRNTRHRTKVQWPDWWTVRE